MKYLIWCQGRCFISLQNGPCCSSTRVSPLSMQRSPLLTVSSHGFLPRMHTPESLCPNSVLLKTSYWIKTGLTSSFQILSPNTVISGPSRSFNTIFQYIILLGRRLHNSVRKSFLVEMQRILILSPLSHSITLIKQLVFYMYSMCMQKAKNTV